MSSNGRIFPGAWPGGDKVEAVNEDERNTGRGHAWPDDIPPGWRAGIEATAKAWADDIDRRAFDHAWSALLTQERLGNESRVRSGRERLGE